MEPRKRKKLSLKSNKSGPPIQRVGSREKESVILPKTKADHVIALDRKSDQCAYQEKESERMEVDVSPPAECKDNLDPQLKDLRSSLAVLLQQLADATKKYPELPQQQDESCDAATKNVMPPDRGLKKRFTPWLEIAGHPYTPLPKQCMFCWRRKPSPQPVMENPNEVNDNGEPSHSCSANISTELPVDEHKKPIRIDLSGPGDLASVVGPGRPATPQTLQDLSDWWSQEEGLSTALDDIMQTNVPTQTAQASSSHSTPKKQAAVSSPSSSPVTESMERIYGSSAATMTSREPSPVGLIGKLETSDHPTNVQNRRSVFSGNQTSKVQNIVTTGGIIRTTDRSSRSRGDIKATGGKTKEAQPGASAKSKTDNPKPGPSFTKPLFKQANRERSTRKPADSEAAPAPPGTMSGQSTVGGERKKPQLEVKPLQKPVTESSVLQNCPLCQVSFDPGSSQLDIDGHIAACLAASSDDVTW